MSLDALKFVIEEEAAPRTKIRVLGIGGGGSNAVARMLDEGVAGVEFFVLNTDLQALAASSVPSQLAIGAKITRGLGAGSDPAVGRQAALEDTEKIIELLEGADMVFVTAGLGGGTGTGAVPVVASLAKELGALTVAVVTKPFGFEGPKRMRQAEAGLAELASVADTVITIPNDQLLRLAPKGTSFFEAFRIADDVLRQAVQGISDIITTPGLINRDFSDIRSIMLGMGYAMMGTAEASGESAALAAAEKAISCPLLEAGGVRGARGVLINITGSSQLGLHEVNEACTLISNATENSDVQINFGVVLDEHLADKVKLTVIATGFERETLPAIQRKRQAAATATALRAELVPQPPPPEPEPVMVAAASEAAAAVSGASASGQEETPHTNGVAGPDASRDPLMPDPFKDLEVPAILRRRLVQ
ncbi:MAG TPA: cell division protein FtsZ [Bryobacteraceae bacterium]|nr:cell division protein FtsZ [Bryobacteraceae bacterium]